MKNAMYAHFKKELDYGRFKYPSIEKFSNSAGRDQIGFWHRMIGQWSDLECQRGISINSRIQSAVGEHDDCPDADVLGTFASLVGRKRQMPRPVMVRLSR